MTTVSVKVDDATAKALERRAKGAGTTLDDFVRQLLMGAATSEKLSRLQAAFALADKKGAKSKGPWKRNELYDR